MKAFKLILNIFLISTLFSCNKKENKSGINGDLYHEIVKYQKENPIDKSDVEFLGDRHFIYKVVILPPKYSNSEDGYSNLGENYYIFISMSVFGLGNKAKNNCYGVYEDKLLQKTVIYDEANLIDKFATSRKKENLDKYIVENSPIIDLLYTVKIYDIIDGKLVFINEMKGNNKKK